jgi:hypothetical protein
VPCGDFRAIFADGNGAVERARWRGEFRESFGKAAFRDSGTGIRYRIEAQADCYRMLFTRLPEIDHDRHLEWFVGSGRLERSYLFTMDGYLFQAPVSCFPKPGTWGLSPGFHHFALETLTRAVEPACLRCHASRLQPVELTVNKYADPPFLEGGVSCGRCHGAGSAHAERMAAGMREGGPAQESVGSEAMVWNLPRRAWRAGGVGAGGLLPGAMPALPCIAETVCGADGGAERAGE